VAALTASLCAPASAQWQGSAGVGMRYATHDESDMAGRRLVREDGWLPGASLRAGYQAGPLTWFGGADWYRGTIDYRGQTQAGSAASSTTSTGLASARLGASYAWAGYALLAAFETDRWQRDIHGTAASAGLQERYRSERLLIGAATTWRPAVAAVSFDAAVVLSAPERLRIGFSGLYDPVSLRTRRGHGLRLGAGIRPAWAPWLELRGRADWLQVPRSDQVALTADGIYRGTVTQPQHVRRGFTLELAYGF
jgi:hypothetical protein